MLVTLIMMESMDAEIKPSTHQKKEEFALPKMTGATAPILNCIPKGCTERTERAHGENYEIPSDRLGPDFCYG